MTIIPNNTIIIPTIITNPESI